jgi:hypothetical protein
VTKDHHWGFEGWGPLRDNTGRKTLLLTLAFASVLLVALGVASSSIWNASQQKGTQSIEALPTFLDKVAVARYGDFTGLPSTRVRSEQAFEEMRRHILDLYAGKRATSAYPMGNQVYDCIIMTPRHVTAPTPVIPPAAGSKPWTGSPQQYEDTVGTSSCEPGSFPMRRVTLDQMVQFPTVHDFLGKY